MKGVLTEEVGPGLDLCLAETRNGVHGSLDLNLEQLVVDTAAGELD